MRERNQAEAAELRLAGGAPPLLPDLAALMPAAPALMDRLVTEFAPTAAALSTQRAYWAGLNGWMTDRLSGPIMEGEVTADELGEQAWAIYASSYWGGLELREHWGMPPALKNLGLTPPSPPFADWEETIRWSSILTFGMEAAGLAAFVAVINSDPEAATRAVMCNALYLGATPGWLIGLLDTGAGLPRVAEAR
jgi:hypothetical protein